LADSLLLYLYRYIYISVQTSSQKGSFKDGDVSWFLNGELNVSYNCVDRHALSNPDNVALIWEADEPGMSQKITYKTLLAEVCRCAGMLKRLGIKKGRFERVFF
jgi:acetyl-CoA synthetase